MDAGTATFRDLHQANQINGPPSFDYSNSSRKASLTSQSKPMSKMFRRKDVEMNEFDEEHGLDIQHLTGNNVSLDDITHIRGRGPYATGGKTLDTTPIIPTLGPNGNISLNPSKVNNLQYRKQMNHQMKMNLASSARAMSLAGGNPMNNDRSMSLGGMSQNNARTMSLGVGQPDPRTMSMGRPVPGSVPGQMYPQGPGGPRAMSLRSPNMNQPMNGQMMNGQMMNNQMYPQQMQMNMNGQMMNGQMMNGQMMNNQMYQQNMNGIPRSMSLGQPLGPMYNSMPQQPMQGPMGLMGQPGQQMYQSQFGNNYPTNSSMSTPINQSSNDLLMNVVEEEDEDTGPPSKSNSHTKVDEATKMTALSDDINQEGKLDGEEDKDDDDDDDVVYKFDDNDENELNSRKSTIKKSNSMRLRKLNLFTNDIQEEPKSTMDVTEKQDTSPTFNVDDQGRFSMVKSSSEEFGHSQEDYRNIGANANESKVYYTASEFSPQKINNQNNQVGGNDYEEGGDETTVQPNDTRNDSNDTVNELDNSSKGMPRDDSKQFKSLTENTAFHNFRQDATNSLESQPVQEPVIPFNNQVNDVRNDSLDQSYDSDQDVSRKSSKTKNFFKRLSLSGDKRSSRQEKRNSVSSLNSNNARRLSKTPMGTPTKVPSTPVVFSKEELGIMTANNELLNELELVTTELASSIKRELKLESKLKSTNTNDSNSVVVDDEEIRNKSKTIIDLQDKLTKERKLRYIAEEHALLLENGQNPSPLKLNYEKTELHRQLIIKNDMVNQLTDKLSEFENQETDPDLINKYNEILKENADLKLHTIPNLEQQITELSNRSPTNNHHNDNDQNNKEYSLVSQYNNTSVSSDEEIQNLKIQRDELRDVITKLNNSHNYEMKLMNEKMKSLEGKISKQNELLRNANSSNISMNVSNDNSNRSSRHLNTSQYNNNNNNNGDADGSFNFNTSGDKNALNILNSKGGKLHGFSIVSADKKFFD